MMTSKYLAFISLSIGFLVIWTAFLSGVLVQRTYKDDVTAQETHRLLVTYEDLGKITFALGHELVSMVDWILLTQHNQTRPEQLTVLWETTDRELQNLRSQSSTRWTIDIKGLIESIEVNLQMYRQTALGHTSPVDVAHYYHELMKLLQQSVSPEQHMTAYSYSLFINGLSQRFIELALSTIYVNSEHSPINRGAFLALRGASEQLMQSSFNFNQRTRIKWQEIQEQAGPQFHVIQESIAESLLAGKTRPERQELKSIYLKDMKKHVTFLLLAKEVLNSQLLISMEKTTQKTRNLLAFHVSLAVVAVTAIVLCLIVMGLSCSYLGNTNLNVRDSIYSTSDKSHILPHDIYVKPQCYL